MDSLRGLDAPKAPLLEELPRVLQVPGAMKLGGDVPKLAGAKLLGRKLPN